MTSYNEDTNRAQKSLVYNKCLLCFHTFVLINTFLIIFQFKGHMWTGPVVKMKKLQQHRKTSDAACETHSKIDSLNTSLDINKNAAVKRYEPKFWKSWQHFTRFTCKPVTRDSKWLLTLWKDMSKTNWIDAKTKSFSSSEQRWRHF